MEFYFRMMAFLFTQLLCVIFTRAAALADVSEGISYSDNPMKDYLQRLQTYFESHLDGSFKDFPTSVVCLPDYDVLSNNTRSEVVDIGNLTCARSSTCRVDWFLFNWVTKNERKGFPLKESLIRVYKKRIGRHVPQEGSIARVNISVYVDLHDALEVHSPSHSYTFTSDRKEWIPVGTIEVKSDVPDGEWLEVNLTSALLSKWNPNATSSLIRVALKLESDVKLPVKIFNMAMLNRTAHADQWRKKLPEQPHMVIFADDPSLKNVLISTNRNLSRIAVPQSGHKNSREKRSTNSGCSRTDYTLTFSDVGLDHIVVPQYLRIGFCTGVCNLDFLTTNPLRFTNHARIMSTAHYEYTRTNGTSTDRITNPGKPKLPCCVPAEYGPVYLLEYWGQGQYKVQLYSDLVVKSCECV